MGKFGAEIPPSIGRQGGSVEQQTTVERYNRERSGLLRAVVSILFVMRFIEVLQKLRRAIVFGATVAGILGVW